jgi:hypothetical protein
VIKQLTEQLGTSADNSTEEFQVNDAFTRPNCTEVMTEKFLPYKERIVLVGARVGVKVVPSGVGNITVFKASFPPIDRIFGR